MAGIPTAGQWPIIAFDPNVVPPPAKHPAILADYIGDDRNGRDFLSLTKSGNPLDQHVRHTICSERDSGPSAHSHGHRLRELRYMDQLVPEVVDTIVREAFQHLIDPGYLTIESVSLNESGTEAYDEGRVHIVYLDRVYNTRREINAL